MWSALLIGVLMVYAGAAQAQPVRILSSNLCADQLALSLAKPEHVVAVSYLSRTPALSLAAAEAAHYPAIKGELEEMLQYRPDLVLVGGRVKPAIDDLLTRQGIAVVPVGMPQNIAAVEAQISDVAAQLGEVQRGRQLILAMQAKLARATLHCKHPPRVAFYYPNGFTDGANTLTQDVLTRIGVKNIAAEQGIDGIGYLPLEKLVEAKPDIIFISRYDPGSPTQGDMVFAHPALGLTQAGKARKVELPGNLLICENHHLGELAMLIAASVKAEGICE